MGQVSMDKYIACLLGGAIGDALGAPVEFMGIDQIRSGFGNNGITDFVEFPNNVGEFTDDTQMTLFTAEGLLRAEHRALLKGFGGSLNYITHHSYLRWLHTQNIDVDLKGTGPWEFDCESGWLVKQKDLYHRRSPGNTCISALSSGIFGKIETPINNSKGCGTIMRMAPVGLNYWNDNETAFRIACELSAITHGHPTGYLSAGFFASVVSDLANEVGLERSIDNAIQILKSWEQHDETLNAVEKALDLFAKTGPQKQQVTPETIERLGSGWTAEEALSISIFVSLLYKDDYTNGVLASVNHSGDSDSTGSVTGNLLGLINGLSSIPQKWAERLKYAYIAIEVAEDLHIKVKGDYDEPDAEWWEKYPGY
jgi:ADP-ribosylglycohydrolase